VEVAATVIALARPLLRERAPATIRGAIMSAVSVFLVIELIIGALLSRLNCCDRLDFLAVFRCCGVIIIPVTENINTVLVPLLIL
jgi:hypothetical protein